MIGEFFGKMFGTDKAAESLISNVSKGIDALVYTDEEKAEDRAKGVSEARSMFVSWLDSTQGQNLARRFIAISVTILWIIDVIATKVFLLCSVWAADPDRYLASVDVIKATSEQVTSAMMLVLGFYFAAPYMGSVVGSVINRFGGPSRK